MILHENCLPADNSHELSCLICYFEKKAAKFEIVVCCKLWVALYGLRHHRTSLVIKRKWFLAIKADNYYVFSLLTSVPFICRRFGRKLQLFLYQITVYHKMRSISFPKCGHVLLEDVRYKGV